MAEKKKEKEENKKGKKEAKEEPVEVKKEETKKEDTPAPAIALVPKAPITPKKMKLAIVHVYSSKNDTIITATDMSGAETLAWASGGMMVKSHREEGKPYAAMQATTKVVGTLKEKGITHVHVKIRAPGGNGAKTPGQGAQAVVRTIARTGLRIGKIEDVTPLPTDSMRRKGGRRGRRV